MHQIISDNTGTNFYVLEKPYVASLLYRCHAFPLPSAYNNNTTQACRRARAECQCPLTIQYINREPRP